MSSPIKVMLVDDEPLALENACEMVPWEEHGFEVAAKATNGRMALKLFEQHRPQIVITDISMSPMDGLELGKRIQQSEPATRLIFLTAYRDFDYARQALEMRAAHYLLKHEISRNRLLEQLLRLKEDIEAEAADRSREKRETLRNFLAGVDSAVSDKSDPVAAGAKKRIEWLQGPLALLYFEIDPVVLLNGSRQTRHWSDDNERSAVEQDIRHQCEEAEEAVIADTDGGGYVVVLKLKAPNSTLLLHYALQKAAASLRNALQARVGSAPRVMMSNCADQELLPALARKMRNNYDYSLFLPFGSFILLSQVPSADIERSPTEEAAFWSRDPDAAELSRLRQALDDIVERRRLRALREAIRQAEANWRKEAAPGETAPRLGDDAREIASAIYRLAESRIKAGKEPPHYSRWVAKAMDYVREHYADPDLSLETVAGSLQISSIHLRTTFKKETGVSLLDFTTEYRIDTAKKLLAQGDLKVYEVSEKVGYKTSQYFSQVFKRLTGVMPKDYVLLESGE